MFVQKGIDAIASGQASIKLDADFDISQAMDPLIFPVTVSYTHLTLPTIYSE